MGLQGHDTSSLHCPVPGWLWKGLMGTLGGDLWRLHALGAFLGRKVAHAECARCFPAMVNINEAVGARPSGRPGLSWWGGMEIKLCTLDRAFNLASEAAGA